MSTALVDFFMSTIGCVDPWTGLDPPGPIPGPRTPQGHGYDRYGPLTMRLASIRVTFSLGTSKISQKFLGIPWNSRKSMEIPWKSSWAGWKAVWEPKSEKSHFWELIPTLFSEFRWLPRMLLCVFMHLRACFAGSTHNFSEKYLQPSGGGPKTIG